MIECINPNANRRVLLAFAILRRKMTARCDNLNRVVKIIRPCYDIDITEKERISVGFKPIKGMNFNTS
jgi:hypothetical protein